MSDKDEDAKSQELIDNSSFGSKEAKAMANQTPKEVADEIVRRLKEREGKK